MITFEEIAIVLARLQVRWPWFSKETEPYATCTDYAGVAEQACRWNKDDVDERFSY